MSGLHVAIIMDGNGRWARQRGKPRWRGHQAGVDSVRDVVRASPELGITTLTLYAFSSDNWKRPAAEVGRLFWLLREYCRREHDELIANGVRVSHVGRRDRLPAKALTALDDLARASAGGTRLHLRLAIDYSAQDMIANAARRLAEEVAAGARRPDEVGRRALEMALTDGVPPVDLLIRSAGEQRLSDFMLWESAYAELVFTPVAWPDFRRANLADALDEFRYRERRFGGLVAVTGGAPPQPAARVAVG
jgi:undecaprenyl diphosphate synthase